MTVTEILFFIFSPCSFIAIFAGILTLIYLVDDHFHGEV